MNKSEILKEMKKAIKKVREKNAVEDVLDSDRHAEMSPDSIPSAGGSVMEKKKKDCNCKRESEEDCECEETAPMDKTEEVVKSIMDNFKRISDAYLAKKENRCWEGYEPTPGKKPYSEGSCQKKNETGDEPTLHPGKGQVSSETQKKVQNIIDVNKKLNERDKQRKERKAKRVKEAQAHAEKLKQQGIKPKFDPMAASEKAKK